MRFRPVYTLLVVLLSVSVIAQDSTCLPLITEALTQAGENCGTLDRNDACYGNPLVDALFIDEMPDDFFTAPTDRSPVSQLRKLSTTPFNRNTEEWGIAFMKLQANLPDTIPGQGVTFVLLGDVETENAVHPDDAFQNTTAISITSTLNAALRSSPAAFSNTRGIVPAQTTVPADGISEDGRWLRVVYDDTPGWVFRDYTDAVNTSPDLPVLNGEQFTPMQAFYLRTTPISTDCEDVPEGGLLLQTPQGISVDLEVNGANIQVGSTIMLKILPPGDVMEITVIDGHVKLFANEFNPSDIDLYTGQISRICLTPPKNRGLDGLANDRVIGCGWSAPVDVFQTTLAAQYCSLENIPATALYYPVDFACELSPFPIATPETTQTPDMSVQSTDIPLVTTAVGNTAEAPPAPESTDTGTTNTDTNVDTAANQATENATAAPASTTAAATTAAPQATIKEPTPKTPVPPEPPKTPPP